MAWVDAGRERQVDALLAAHRHDHVLRATALGQSVVLCDEGPQLGQASVLGISVPFIMQAALRSL